MQTYEDWMHLNGWWIYISGTKAVKNPKECPVEKKNKKSKQGMLIN